MKTYEVMYVVKPQDDENIEIIASKIKQMFEQNNAKVMKEDLWGVKRLAVEVQGYTNGYYVLVTFRATSAIVSKLDKHLRAMNDVLRHIIISTGNEV